MTPRLPLRLFPALACAAFAIATAQPLCASGQEAPKDAAPIEATLDLSAPGYTFRAWGTSLAWWAHGVGAWPEPVVDEIVRAITDPVDGLGMTLFRYNIGGGDHPDHKHMRNWGDVPGFRASADAPYDWNSDANQRRILLKLVAACRGEAMVEAFSNSPPWWMTESGCAAGAKDGGRNLRMDAEQAFIDYLADVCAHYQERHGLRFHSLEPMNEPDARWWKAGGNQEGCHVPPDQQARLIRLARAALDARGLSSTLVSATDANKIDEALKSLVAFDAPTLRALGQVNAHSYYGKLRRELREAAAERGLPLWQSESGPLYVGGDDAHQIYTMARRIVVDLNHLRPEVWATWQVVSHSPWGAIEEDSAKQTVKRGRKFHMLATFTQALRPGDEIIPQDSSQVLLVRSRARRELVVFLVNDAAHPQPAHLSFAGGGAPAPRASLARASSKDSLDPMPDLSLESGITQIDLPPQSVTRLRFTLESSLSR